MENEIDVHYIRADQPETREPLEVFTQIATDLGLIRPGDKLGKRTLEYALAVVEKCATGADCYFDNRKDMHIGEHIRAVYGRRYG